MPSRIQRGMADPAIFLTGGATLWGSDVVHNQVDPEGPRGVATFTLYGLTFIECLFKPLNVFRV